MEIDDIYNAVISIIAKYSISKVTLFGSSSYIFYKIF